ncbi:WD and tetratricopeptide repeats protein 1-like [Ruditapes philippinarum]|uniref:WD and tetratricopeptide repeats protein 1-like n=1 Tax=Ruditapes philippinarum TaxID=129788 RepID=UPI00295C355B|nr:WD and tetratricopeptide repeats protein 1-like [Ruditapes philippinarum]
MEFKTNLLKRKLLREINENIGARFVREQQVTSTLIKRLGLEDELEGHIGCVNCLEWNEKGSMLASGSDDTQVIVWDPFRKKKLTSIQTGHHGNIFSVKFLPNSNDNIVVSGAADSKIRVHDIEGKETTHVFACHASRVKRIATAPKVPFMFWSAAEDGCVMQFDLRCPELCHSNSKNVLINLDSHVGGQAEFKCIAINPARPELMAVGANDPYVRMYDRRMLTCQSLKMSDDGHQRFSSTEEFPLPRGCVEYYVPGHIPQKKDDYRKKLRALAATYVTFSPDGTELLTNLGGEQIYLFDVNKKRSIQKFDISMVLNSNGIVKESCHASVNGYSTYRNGSTTNGVVTNGVSKHLHDSVQAPHPNAQGDHEKPVKKHKTEKKPLPPLVESLKKKANTYFEKEQYTKAIILYNQAIACAPHASMLYGNRAAAFMKRKWDGDMYAALRDCHNALRLDLNHLKAHFRLAKCLNELSWSKEAFECLNHFKSKFPDYATSRACEQLDKDIRAAIFSKTESDESSKNKKGVCGTDFFQSKSQPSELEQIWRAEANDYEARFCGHCNTTTDIKEANFFGSHGQYIVAGSDDGSFFIWEKCTTNIVRVLRGDESIVNCLQPHPSHCLLATSGIDPVVRLWSPQPEDGKKNDREIDNSDDAALANQKRMNADPLEVMLMNMGYRLSSVDDSDGDSDRRGSEAQVTCPTS